MPAPSAPLAALPLALVFGLIAAGVRTPRAAAAGALAAIALAMGPWGTPPALAAWAVLYGCATGLFPIVYIIFGSLLLYQLTVVTGWAERLRASLAGVSDRHVLLLLVGFGFAAFLDATAGFLTPVTVATALLAGLGVPAIEAAGYTLVATSLVAIFGGMGIPVVVLAEAGRVPAAALAAAQVRLGAPLLAALPVVLTLAFGGPRTLARVWRAAIGAGAAYAGVLALVVTGIGFVPAGLAASLAAVAAVVATTWRAGRHPDRAPVRSALAPWWPYAVLVAAVAAWSIPAVARALGRLTVAPRFGATGLAWRLDVAASPGTAILVAAALVVVLGRVSRADAARALGATATQVRAPLAGILAMFALAQVMAASGMTRTLGLAVAGSGRAFPLLSPALSMLGGAIAGSNTASHALLGALQAATARALGLDGVHALAVCAIAAPLGKIVAPQVVAAAAIAGGVPWAERRLIGTGLLHVAGWLAAVVVAGWAAG